MDLGFRRDSAGADLDVASIDLVGHGGAIESSHFNLTVTPLATLVALSII
jgi:hypothetical protein